MSLKRYLEKVRYIDCLIRKKCTGSPKMLAEKTGLSPSSVNNYLNDMRQEGFPIRYCRKRQTYYYEKDGEMVTSLFNEALSEETMKQISGGISYSEGWSCVFFLNL